MTGTPLYPGDWASEIKKIKQQLKDLFTAAQTRIAFAKIVAQVLTVGDTDQQIIIKPNGGGQIQFHSSGATTNASVVAASSNNPADGTGLLVSTSGMTGTVAAHGRLNVFPSSGVTIQHTADNGTGSAEVSASLAYDSSGNATGGVNLSAQSTVYPSQAWVGIQASGGLILPALAANPTPQGIAVIYTVGNSLRWMDAAGTVHVIV